MERTHAAGLRAIAAGFKVAAGVSWILFDIYGHIIEAYNGDRRLRYEYDKFATW